MVVKPTLAFYCPIDGGDHVDETEGTREESRSGRRGAGSSAAQLGAFISGWAAERSTGLTDRFPASDASKASCVFPLILVLFGAPPIWGHLNTCTGGNR